MNGVGVHGVVPIALVSVDADPVVDGLVGGVPDQMRASTIILDGIPRHRPSAVHVQREVSLPRRGAKAAADPGPVDCGVEYGIRQRVQGGRHYPWWTPVGSSVLISLEVVITRQCPLADVDALHGKNFRS